MANNNAEENKQIKKEIRSDNKIPLDNGIYFKDNKKKYCSKMLYNNYIYILKKHQVPRTIIPTRITIPSKTTMTPKTTIIYQ